MWYTGSRVPCSSKPYLTRCTGQTHASKAYSFIKFKSWKGLKSRTNAGFIPKKKDVRVKPYRSRPFQESPLFLKTKFLTGQNCVQEYNQVKNVRQCQKAEFHPSKSTFLPTHNEQFFYSTKKTIELTTPHSV